MLKLKVKQIVGMNKGGTDYVQRQQYQIKRWSGGKTVSCESGNRIRHMKKESAYDRR